MSPARTLLIAAICAAAVPAAAQDQVEAGLAAWKSAPCASCHGVFAQGGGGGEQPEGPSLRRTQLDKTAIAETIRCGRPGTPMPFFLKGAYSEAECWGQKGAPPAEVANAASLTPADIDAMVEYLMARIVGKSSTVSKAECAAYYGSPTHPRCQ